jgi:protease-4
MKQFFKFMFASMLGFLLMSIVIFFLFLGMVSSLAKFMEKETAKVAENTVLHVKFDAEIRDRTSKDPFSDFDYNTMQPKSSLGLNDILKSLEKASNDPKIKGIYLDLSTVKSGGEFLEEIRTALLKFKESEKFIIAYGESYSQNAYYLGSVADKVYLNPEGSIDFKGISAEVTFFKEMIDKIDAEMQIIRHGKYKSAVEPFMLDKMSSENREQMMALVTGIWNTYLNSISESRNITTSELNRIADNLLIRTAKDAVQFNFVDDLKYYDEIIAELKSLCGTKEGDELNSIKLSKYFTAPSDSKEKKDFQNRIAIV